MGGINPQWLGQVLEAGQQCHGGDGAAQSCAGVLQFVVTQLLAAGEQLVQLAMPAHAVRAGGPNIVLQVSREQSVGFVLTAADMPLLRQ